MSTRKHTVTFTKPYSGARSERIHFSADADLSGSIWPRADGAYCYALYTLNDHGSVQDEITRGECYKQDGHSARSICMCEVNRIGAFLIRVGYQEIIERRDAAQAILDGRVALVAAA